MRPSLMVVEADGYIDDPFGCQHYIGRWTTYLDPNLFEVDRTFVTGTVLRHSAMPISIGQGRLRFDVTTRPLNPQPRMSQSVN